jgi:hypothetical protein
MPVRIPPPHNFFYPSYIFLLELHP